MAIYRAHYNVVVNFKICKIQFMTTERRWDPETCCMDIINDPFMFTISIVLFNKD